MLVPNIAKICYGREVGMSLNKLSCQKKFIIFPLLKLEKNEEEKENSNNVRQKIFKRLF